MLTLALTVNDETVTAPVAPTSLEFGTSQRGFAGLRAMLPATLEEAFRLYDTSGMVRARVADDHANIVWDGRIEDWEITRMGIAVTGFGYWRALSDLPYTALWSVSTSAGWRELQTTEVSISKPKRGSIDNNNRVFLAINKNSQTNTSNYIAAVYELPDKGDREAATIAFDYVLTNATGATYHMLMRTYNSAWSQVDSSTVISSNANASGSYSFSIGAAVTRVALLFARNSGTLTTYSGETGELYARATNIRIKTTDSAAVYLNEIAQEIATYVNAENPEQLSDTILDLAADGLDFGNELYEDANPAQILEELAESNGYHVGVWDDQRIRIEAYADAGLDYYADIVGELQVQRSLDSLTTEGYARYKEEGGRTLRTSTAVTLTIGGGTGRRTAVNKYGIARRSFVGADTTSSTTADSERDAFLADRGDYAIRVSMTIRAVFDASGARVPLYQLRAHDRITIRNLSPSLSATIDNIRSFTIARTNYNAADDSIQLEPAIPVPTLVTMIAARRGTVVQETGRIRPR